MNLKHRLSAVLPYVWYPLLAALTWGYMAYELGPGRIGPDGSSKLGQHMGLYMGVLLSLMLLLETTHALRTEWRMTWATFLRRDLPFMAIGGVTLGAVNFLVTRFIAGDGIERSQWLAQLPLLPGVLLSLLVTEFFWYWMHRWSHEGRSVVARFFGRVHMAHHLPQQVYVLMHAINHPINTVVVRAVLVAPPFLLGFSPEVSFVASVVLGFQAIVSHFNVDCRIGWLNYVLVGTELHRYHHSTESTEAKNYGVVLTVWDIVFGTFVYKAGDAPRKLGISESVRMPKDTQILSVLLAPIRRLSK